MEKRIKETRKFILLETFLLCISIILLITFICFKKLNTNNVEKKNLLTQEYEQRKQVLAEKENELKLVDKESENYKDVKTRINETKDEYFKLLSKIEKDIKENKTNKKIAYLTFDDGPYYNTYKVLDILDKYNVKATFFTTTINGQYCYDNKSYNCYKLYKEYIKRGHTIANHTYTHAIRKGLYESTESFMKAVKDQENHVKEQTDGYITNILRFPGGSSTARELKSSIINELRKEKYGWVDWNGADGDGGKLSSEDEAWNYFKNTINEKIEVILYHDYSRYTTNLLQQMI